MHGLGLFYGISVEIVHGDPAAVRKLAPKLAHIVIRGTDDDDAVVAAKQIDNRVAGTNTAANIQGRGSNRVGGSCGGRGCLRGGQIGLGDPAAGGKLAPDVAVFAGGFFHNGDNGIPFEVESLVSFGIVQRTTHEADGGSGIGTMEIWKIKENNSITLGKELRIIGF